MWVIVNRELVIRRCFFAVGPVCCVVCGVMCGVVCGTIRLICAGDLLLGDGLKEPKWPMPAPDCILLFIANHCFTQLRVEPAFHCFI